MLFIWSFKKEYSYHSFPRWLHNHWECPEWRWSFNNVGNWQTLWDTVQCSTYHYHPRCPCYRLLLCRTLQSGSSLWLPGGHRGNPRCNRRGQLGRHRERLPNPNHDGSRHRSHGILFSILANSLLNRNILRYLLFTFIILSVICFCFNSWFLSLITLHY